MLFPLKLKKKGKKMIFGYDRVLTSKSIKKYLKPFL